MALDTFDNLVASIQAWLFGRSDLASVAPDFIRLAEAEHDRRVRHRLMTVISDPFAFSGELTSLPADFRAPVSLATSTRVLRYVTPEQYEQDRICNQDASTCEFAILGSQVAAWPAPAAATPGRLIYLQAIPALGSGNETNWLLTRWPDAYLFGALMQAAPYLGNDDRIPVWQSRWEQALEEIRVSNASEMARGASVRAHFHP